MDKKDSRWIVLDGIDGSGKGSQLKFLQHYLWERNKRYSHLMLVREPTYGQYGMQARQLLVADSDPMANAERCLELFVADRKENMERYIIPHLEKGGIVLQDRGKYSTLAYQAAQGIDPQRIVDMHLGLRVPDLAILLCLDAQEALRRRQVASGKTEKFEKLEFLTKVNQYFERMDAYFSGEMIFMVEAGESKEEVFESIRKAVEPILPF